MPLVVVIDDEDSVRRALIRLLRSAGAEARIKEIDAELASMASIPTLRQLDLKRIERDVSEELERFDNLLHGDVPAARQALKRILTDRVEFNPAGTDDGRRTYSFRGELAYNGVILDGKIGVHATNPPGESNPR